MQWRHSLLGIREWLDFRNVLKEVQTLDLKIFRGDLHNVNPLISAKAYLMAGNETEALRQWEEALARHPTLVQKSQASIHILLALKHFDEAEAFMISCQKLFPRDPQYAEGYALISQRRGDVSEAIRRWQRARKRFPGAWKSYVQEAACHCPIRHWDEAEALINRAIQLFPQKLDCRIQWGRIADQKEDWVTAVQKWEWIKNNFDWAGVAIGMAHALERLGNSNKALEVLVAALKNYPRDTDLTSELNRRRRRTNLDKQIIMQPVEEKARPC